MAQQEVGNMTGLMATEDDTAAAQAKNLFKYFHRSRTVRELKEQVRKLPARSFGMPVSRRPGERELLKVVLLDIQMPSLSGKEMIHQMRQKASEAVVILLTSKMKDALDNALDAGADDVLLKPFRSEDLSFRIQRALQQRRRESPIQGVDAPMPHLVEKLHRGKSGQLDAERVAEFFGVSLTQVARSFKRQVSTVHKTPNAPSLQSDLRQLESIASGLMRLTGSERRSRMWLQASNPALDQHAPIELMKMGKVSQLQQFVQDLLDGRPA